MAAAKWAARSIKERRDEERALAHRLALSLSALVYQHVVEARRVGLTRAELRGRSRRDRSFSLQLEAEPDIDGL